MEIEKITDDFLALDNASQFIIGANLAFVLAACKDGKITESFIGILITDSVLSGIEYITEGHIPNLFEGMKGYLVSEL
jgi:hypothetical protein